MARKLLLAIPLLASLTFSASLLAQTYAPPQQPTYSPPASGYQQPSYQAAPAGYPQQQPSYQQPSQSYQQPAQSYQQQPQGYQQQQQSSYQQPAQGYQQPQRSYQAQPTYQQPAAGSYQAAPSNYTQPGYTQPSYTQQPNYSQQAPALVVPPPASYPATSSYPAPTGYSQQPAAGYPANRSYQQSGYPQQGAAAYPAVPAVPASYPPPSNYAQQGLYQQLNGGAAPAAAGTLAAPTAALAASAAAVPGVAGTQHPSGTQPPADAYHAHRDSKYGHEHVYPDRGTIVQQVPQGSNVINYAGLSYRFYDAVWYEPRGPAFMVVEPPIGLVVPALPPFATTVSSEGANYVYANDTFYRARPELGGYQVVNDPTAGTARTAAPELQPSEPPIGSSMTVYPRNGQTAQEQSRDHYECYRFAVAQTGYDPMRANAGDAPAKIAELQSAYDRAQSACFEGRGYTIR